MTLTAFGRIGIRPTELTREHLNDAFNEANLLQGRLSAMQPNLWLSSIFQITLVQGTAVYNLPNNMVAIQDVYITTAPSAASASDRLIFPVTLFEYDALPNKTIQAPPTTYLIQRLIPTPTITFWQVPDGNAVYQANVRYLAQPQDVAQSGGITVNVPYIFLDAFVAGLAHRLARIYAPDKEQLRKVDADEAWAAAAKTDAQDSTNLYIQLDFGGYVR